LAETEVALVHADGRNLQAVNAGGWYADPPPGARAPGPDPEDYTISGDTIRFSWDYMVDVPLWDAEGGLPPDSDWLRRALGISGALVEELRRWDEEMCALIDHRRPTPKPALDQLNERAEQLVERLRDELRGRYKVKYIPWLEAREGA